MAAQLARHRLDDRHTLDVTELVLGIAHGRTVEDVADELGADSLHYLSLEGVYEAVGVSRDAHCDADRPNSTSKSRSAEVPIETVPGNPSCSPLAP